MNRNKQRGVTIVELLAAIAGLVGIAAVLFMLYAVAHFILKFW